jgi:hypothetical protein
VLELQPRISVLVPCWNAAGSVERALASVLDAEERSVQVVVVDDASTDDTVGVVRAIAARDPRVELVVAPENGGASAARNLGLPLVRGEWLTFLDSDDRLLPGGLDALYRAAVATDALAVVGQRIWSDGVTTWITRTYDRPDIRLPGRKSLVRNPGLLFYASGTGKLFHRSVTAGLEFEGRVLGDQPWTLRALLRAGDRIEVIADDVYEWDRPGPGHEFTSITEEKRRSAAKAADAVRVAIGAWRAVADEAERVLPDEASREVIRDAYLDRLVRSDFAGPVTRALESRDPGAAILFEELERFIRSVPPAIVGRSRAVVERLVMPPIVRWYELPATARPAFWAMVRAIPSGPALRARVNRQLPGQVAVRIGRRFPGRRGTAAAGLAATVTGLAARLADRFRR